MVGVVVSIFPMVHGGRISGGAGGGGGVMFSGSGSNWSGGSWVVVVVVLVVEVVVVATSRSGKVETKSFHPIYSITTAVREVIRKSRK